MQDLIKQISDTNKSIQIELVKKYIPFLVLFIVLIIFAMN